MNAALARWLMALATSSMGGLRRDWAHAMQAEFDVAIDDGRPLSFAAGCLAAAWRELPRHPAGRFAMASHALALLLILPMAALLLSGAMLGFPYLASARAGPFGLSAEGASSLLLNDGNVAVAPSLTLLMLMLAAVDCRAAWLLLDRNWAGAATLTRLHAAATVTLVIVSAMLALDVTRLLLPVACLVTQSLAIPALAPGMRSFAAAGPASHPPERSVAPVRPAAPHHPTLLHSPWAPRCRPVAAARLHPAEPIVVSARPEGEIAMTFHRPVPVLALLLYAAPVASPALAQADEAIEVGRWQVFGTTPAFGRDAGVPGGGYVRAAARRLAGEPWSSGAGMALPRAVRAGERVTAVFWARSARATDVPVTIQGGPPGYAALATGRLALSPRWQRHAIGGVASTDLAAGSQSLTIHLGQVRDPVSLGPVVFLRGAPDPAAVDRAAERFRPVQLADDVGIASDPGVELAATLRLPARVGGAPYPVVILLAGHGPWPRGGFPLLVDRLTAAGIATLDYDKRGIGQSTGTHLDTMESTERDAAAAVAYLRTRPDIDKRRIALLGLSQGGVIAPAVAAADPLIAAVVMLAGPAGERGTMFLDAMRATLISGGTRRDAVEPIITAAAAFMDAQAADAPGSAIQAREEALRAAFLAGGHPPAKVAGFIATLGNPVVVSQYRVAANDALRAIKAPVLALYATDDDVVLTAQSLPQAKAALAANADATVTALPRVNHSFQRQKAGADGKPVFAGPSVSDPTTLDLVTSWLEERLRAPR